MHYRTIALAGTLLVVLSGCGANSASPGSAGGTDAAATSPTADSKQVGKAVSITVKVGAPWAPIINSYIDPQPLPNLLNAPSLDCIGAKNPTEECGTVGPLRGEELQVMCQVDGLAGIVGVLIPQSAMQFPDRLMYRSTTGDQPIGFTNIEYLDDHTTVSSRLTSALQTTPDGASSCDALTYKVT